MLNIYIDGIYYAYYTGSHCAKLIDTIIYEYNTEDNQSILTTGFDGMQSITTISNTSLLPLFPYIGIRKYNTHYNSIDIYRAMQYYGMQKDIMDKFVNNNIIIIFESYKFPNNPIEDNYIASLIIPHLQYNNNDIVVQSEFIDIYYKQIDIKYLLNYFGNKRQHDEATKIYEIYGYLITQIESYKPIPNDIKKAITTIYFKHGYHPFENSHYIPAKNKIITYLYRNFISNEPITWNELNNIINMK